MKVKKRIAKCEASIENFIEDLARIYVRVVKLEQITDGPPRIAQNRVDTVALTTIADLQRDCATMQRRIDALEAKNEALTKLVLEVKG